MNKICVAHFLKRKAHLPIWGTERVILKEKLIDQITEVLRIVPQLNLPTCEPSTETARYVDSAAFAGCLGMDQNLKGSGVP
jgi:hypothetical protein